VTVSNLSGTSHVTELFLPANNLAGDLTPTISGLPHLKQLNLQNNALTSLPETIHQLTGLEQIAVSYNTLVSLPAWLFQLPRLLILEAEHNYIASLPAIAHSWTRLELLSLHHNRLTTLPSSFSELTALRQLFLQNNLYIEQPTVLFSMDELLTVHLAWNKLSWDLNAWWESLGNLIYLNITNNQLTHEQNGEVIIPPSLTQWYGRHGFVLVGDGQRWDADQRISLVPNQPVSPVVQVTPLPFTISLSEYVRSLLVSDQQPILIVWWTDPLCQQLDVVLEITPLDEIQLRLLPKVAGHYLWCTLQITDFDGTLLPPREIPEVTVVLQAQLDFCDNPLLTVSEEICHALLSLYTATNGNNRKNKSWWFVTPQVENRFGLRTQSTSGTSWVRVNWLSFHHYENSSWTNQMNGQWNGLQWSLPDIFDFLTGLETINLWNNILTWPLPWSFASLNQLKEIYLHHNQLNGSLDMLINPSLRVVYLKNNQFIGEVVWLFSGLSSLEVIDLSKNNFSGILPVFSVQAPIRFVNLADNDFTGKIPAIRAQSSKQTHLYLQNNNLEGIIPTTWKNRTWLTNLAVDGNFLNRDLDNSATLATDLIPRWQWILVKSRSNQRDGIAPIISAEWWFTASGASMYLFEISVKENSYAINVSEQWMPVFVSGWPWCESLQISDVRVATWTTTLTVVPASAWIFEWCVLHVLDHGQNFSNAIELPVLWHNLGEQAICFTENLTIPQDECRILRDLYTSTSWTQWTNKNNRWQTQNVNSWFGIDTENIGWQEHIVSILLHRNDITSLNTPVDQESKGNNLRGVLPSSVDWLAKLRYFKADNNDLWWSLAMLNQLTLEVLTLSHNDFTGNLPTHRNSWSLLRELDLSNNMFVWWIPTAVRQLKKIETLLFHSNQLSWKLEITPQDRWSLIAFSVANNALTWWLDPDWSLQKRLEKIDFANNTFVWTIPSAWAVLTWLKEVNLSQNKLSGPIPTSFSSWNKITHFYASWNALIWNINDLFPSWNTIKALDVSDNRFTWKLALSRAQFTNLQNIFLAKNALDRDSNNDALIPFGLINRWESRLFKSRENQDDRTPTVLSSTTTVLSPISAYFSFTLKWQENSYTVTESWTGLLLWIDWSTLCSWLLLSQTQIATWWQQTWTVEFLLSPTISGIHTCFLTVTDHGWNISRLPITPFLFDATCGNWLIESNEQCDEWRICMTNEQLDCTGDWTVCPFACVTSMVDNCTPACNQSVCGDKFIDTNGLDNTLWTQDDELCDVWSFCPDWRDCTDNPTICSWWPASCQTRFTSSCSPVCAPSSCGDWVLDEEEEEDCDDANMISGDGCSSSCKVEYCGDGLIDANGADQQQWTADDEECDVWPGNGLRAGQCNQFCKINEQTCQWCFETCHWWTGNHSIFLLIDVSGSMEGNKMQKAKQWAQEFVQRVLSGSLTNSWFVTKIWLIKFSSNGTTVQTPTTNYTTLINAIQTLEAWWSTNFGDPLNKAKTYFASNDTWFTKHIILLSDGLPTVWTSQLSPEEWSIAVADATKDAWTNIYTIAVEQTEEWIELMRTISSASYVNLAIDKTVSQSSTQSSRSASRAIDSDKSNYSQTRNDAKAWWQIDLWNQFGVREVKVWNRSNLWSETSNFYVLWSPTPFTSTNLTTTLAQSGVIATYFTWTAQRPTIIPFDASVRYMRIQLAWTNRLQLAELEIFWCLSEWNCDMVFNYEDYTSEMIGTLYSHIFWSIHCGCGPYQICGVCGDGNIDSTYGEVCDEGSFCDNGTDCSTDPWLCPSECRPRTSQECTNLCQLPFCGDWFVQTGKNEQCDDWNNKSWDGCSTTCLSEICGDGLIDSNWSDNILWNTDDEQCDDSNTISGDGCSSICKAEICGDWQITWTEQCDEWRFCDNGTSCTDNPWICPGECKTRSTDTCTVDCSYGMCGDWYTDNNWSNNTSGDSDDEQCDPGKFCSNGIPCSHDESLCPWSCEVRFTTTCTQFCKITYCGDGYVDLDGVDDNYNTVYDNEQCDDWNNRYGDGCSPTCLLEWTDGLHCWDGIKQAYELCDPSDISDPWSATCSSNCIPRSCGDGIISWNESCDTGKWCEDWITSCTHDPTICPTWPTECQTRYIAWCTENCVAWCGNLILDSDGVDNIAWNQDDEQCDDSDLSDTDSCTNTCKLPECGDWILTHYALIPGSGWWMVPYMETCDDGNTNDGDSCPSTCTGSGNAMTWQCAAGMLQSLFYDNENTTFADISVFCDRWIPDGSPIFDENSNTWQWVCLWILWWDDDICRYDAWACGDGIVDTRTDPVSWITVEEECDDGNVEAWDGCTASCQFETPLVFPLSWQCSMQSYPAIQPSEYLPVRWAATPRSIATGSCEWQQTNTIIDAQDMLCDFVVTRWNPAWYEQEVGTVTLPCFGMGTWSQLIEDALLDKWEIKETQLWWWTISPTQIVELSMDIDRSIIYWQYRLSLQSIRFNYCAKTRLQSGWIPQTVVLEREFIAWNEPLCQWQRSLSPSYFMQHTMLFSEQKNTWLEAKITNIAWENVYLADTSYTKLQKSTYWWSIKKYLLDWFINEKVPLAKKSFRVDSEQFWSLVFQKIPSSYTFVYPGSAPLTLDRQTIGYLLSQAWVWLWEQETTPFTLIIPDQRVTTTLVWDMPWTMMLVTNGNIVFSAENCDTNDVVQWIYVANWTVTTTKTVNDRLDANERCNWWWLTIQWLILWRDLATTLWSTRRSSIHFWENNNLLYPSENNVSHLADTYYTSCVQAPLLYDMLYTKMSTWSLPLFWHPITWCLPGTITWSMESQKMALIDLLFKKNWYFDRVFHENNTPLTQQFLQLLPSATTATINSLTTISVQYGNKVYRLDIPAWKKQQLINAKKQFPDFFTTSLDLNDPVIQKKVMSLFEPEIENLYARFQNIDHPYQKNNGQSSIHTILEWVWWDQFVQWLQEQTVVQSWLLCNASLVWTDWTMYDDQLLCQLTYSPLYTWIINAQDTYKTNKQSKESLLLQWAWVQVVPAPTLRQNPPPGATDIFSSLIISR
jgi:cysteine-rich repeat protein